MSDNGIIKKFTAYIILGVNKDGYKEILQSKSVIMKAVNFGLVFEQLEKQICSIHYDYMCRWTYGHKVFHLSCFSAGKISALYSSSSKEYIGVCG